MFKKGTRIAFIGAHPDDIELGCGATISRYGKSWNISCLTLSVNTDNNPPALLGQNKKSFKTLGVPATRQKVLNFTTREFSYSRQEICESLNDLKKDFKPQVVFTHSNNDLHQDHKVTSDEVTRIFREITVIYFNISRATHLFVPNLFLDVTKKDVKRKIDALNCYKIYKKYFYFKPEAVESLLRAAGLYVNVEFAESFEIARMVHRV